MPQEQNNEKKEALDLLIKLTNENFQLEADKQELQAKLWEKHKANKLWELRYRQLCNEFDNHNLDIEREREREQNDTLGIKNDAK